jgi:hypothetical protein
MCSSVRTMLVSSFHAATTMVTAGQRPAGHGPAGGSVDGGR